MRTTGMQCIIKRGGTAAPPRGGTYGREIAYICLTKHKHVDVMQETICTDTWCRSIAAAMASLTSTVGSIVAIPRGHVYHVIQTDN